jgi:Concanavalin A-like lectin/glucanases superfamily
MKPSSINRFSPPQGVPWSVCRAVASFLVAISAAAQVSTNGLVGWYQAEGNTLDSAGHNDGTAVNVLYAPGRIGSAFLFDGATSGVSLGVPVDFNFPQSESFTLAAWFDSFGPNAPMSNGDIQDGQAILFLNYNCSGTPTAETLSIPAAGGPVSFMVRDLNGATVIVRSPSSPSFNSFHLAVGVREVSGTNKTVRLYLDGELAASGVDPTSAALFSGVNSWIGRRNSCLSDNVFNGLIDDVRIYNRALTDSDVRSLYDAGGRLSLAISSNPAGAATAMVTGVVSNQTVILQSSDNLTNWVSVRTNEASGPTLQFTDLIPPGVSDQFFRVLTP